MFCMFCMFCVQSTDTHDERMHFWVTHGDTWLATDDSVICVLLPWCWEARDLLVGRLLRKYLSRLLSLRQRYFAEIRGRRCRCQQRQLTIWRNLEKFVAIVPGFARVLPCQGCILRRLAQHFQLDVLRLAQAVDGSITSNLLGIVWSFSFR